LLTAAAALGAGGDAESAARAGVPNTDLAIGLGCQAADAATAMATAAPTTTAGRPFIMRENIDLTASGIVRIAAKCPSRDFAVYCH
jgi:hypothetical protein